MKLDRWLIALFLVPLVIVIGICATPPRPEIPSRVETVCVMDENGIVSIIHPTFWKPGSLEELRGGVMNAVNLAGRSMNREDVIQASTDVTFEASRPGFRKNPQPPGTGICGCGGGCGTCELCKVVCDKDNCHTVCVCAAPIYCQTASQ